MVKVEILDDRRRFDHCAIAVDQDGKLACRGEAADGLGIFRVLGVEHQKFERHVALVESNEHLPIEGGERVAVDSHHRLGSSDEF